MLVGRGRAGGERGRGFGAGLGEDGVHRGFWEDPGIAHQLEHLAGLLFGGEGVDGGGAGVGGAGEDGTGLGGVLDLDVDDVLFDAEEFRSGGHDGTDFGDGFEVGFDGDFGAVVKFDLAVLGERPDGLLEGVESFEFHAEDLGVGEERFPVEFLQLAFDGGVDGCCGDAEASGDLAGGDAGLAHLPDAEVAFGEELPAEFLAGVAHTVKHRRLDACNLDVYN